MATSLAEKARDFALRIRGGLVLTVEGGAHAGARLKANGPDLSVGSAPTNDAVLIADALAPIHFRVRLTDIWQSRATITAENDTVLINGGKTLLPGQYQRLQLPVQIRAGQATIRVGMTRDWLGLITGPKAVATVGLLLTLVVAAHIVAPFTRTIRPTIGTDPVEAMASKPSWNAESSQAAMTALRDELGRAGLGGEIRLEAGPSGALVAMGSVDPSLSDKWRDVLRWYDARPGSPLLVNNVARGSRSSDLPSIRAVWVDVNPQVVLASGQTARLGDTVTGGWRIDAIDRQGVVVLRAGRSVRVPFSSSSGDN